MMDDSQDQTQPIPPPGRALDALAIIERVIYEERDLPRTFSLIFPTWPYSDAGLRCGEESAGESDAARFAWAVRTWLRTVYRLEQDQWSSDGGAWLVVLRPWLSTIVGWYAVTDLGRAADGSGYALLVGEMNRISHGAW